MLLYYSMISARITAASKLPSRVSWTVVLPLTHITVMKSYYELNATLRDRNALLGIRIQCPLELVSHDTFVQLCRRSYIFGQAGVV